MAFDNPNIDTYRTDLDNNITVVQKLKTDSHATIKIQSLLNITIYVLATRFLEGSIKHIIYNCCVMRGDNEEQLSFLESELRKFNNPEFSNIQSAFIKYISFDLKEGLKDKWFSERDISLLNEIVKNRHRNVHSTHDPSDWYSKNLKDLNDFNKEYSGLLNILSYLDLINWDSGSSIFKV